MAIMREIIPLENLLSQLTEMYHQILYNQDKKPLITPETLEALQRVSRELEEISRLTNLELARAGISQETIQKTLLEPKSQLPPDIQNLLEKAQYLKNQLQGCKNILKEIMKQQKKEKVNKGKRFSEKRKDKFKNVGGKKGWIPL